jgi:hypothetical protein
VTGSFEALIPSVNSVEREIVSSTVPKAIEVLLALPDDSGVAGCEAKSVVIVQSPISQVCRSRNGTITEEVQLRVQPQAPNHGVRIQFEQSGFR